MRTAIGRGVLVLLAGCGGTGIDVHTTQDNVCDQIARVACFDMFQCCSEAEIESVLMVDDPRTETDCQSDLRRRCERQRADFALSVKNQRVRFDATAMDACLTAFVVPPGTCATIAAAKPWAEACMTSAWVGIVEAGGTCDFAYECAPDSVCTGRTCTALPTENMPCMTRGGCATGLWCDFGATGGPTCEAQRGSGGACNDGVECQKGLFCDTGGFFNGSCGPPHANGETCDANAGCTSTLCLSGTCTNNGASCLVYFFCRSCSPDNGVVCINALDCEPGRCGGPAGGQLCFNDADCFLSMAPLPCVNPPTCNVGRCTGNVCADRQLTIDYCTSVLADLPLLGGQLMGGGGD